MQVSEQEDRGQELHHQGVGLRVRDSEDAVLGDVKAQNGHGSGQ